MEDKKEVKNLKLRIKYFGFSLVIGTFRAVSKFSFKFENIKELVSRCYYYFKIWLLMSKNSFIVMLEQKKLFFLFLLGKVLRFGFFILFLVFLVKGTENLAGYNSNQVIFFFLTFNLVDIVSQFLFREVYRFRPLLVTGDFDLVMTKPMNALFRVLMGGADVIDFITIPPLHILVLAFGIITLEIDHVIWIYRDLTNLGRFPVDIYRQPIQGILTYLIPVGIMMTFPVKAMLGLISSWGILFSFSLGILMVILSIKLWNIALKNYTSASS